MALMSLAKKLHYAHTKHDALKNELVSQDLIVGFLLPAEIRLGVKGGGIDDIKRHPFFARKTDWISLYYKVVVVVVSGGGWRSRCDII